MSRIHLSAPVALCFVFLASSASAQVFSGGENQPPLTNPGGVTERDDVQTCQASGGGTRTRANCNIETTTVNTVLELKLPPAEAPVLSDAQCEAEVTSGYHQRNTLARLESTIKVSECAAAGGAFTVAARVRDDAGEIKVLEFPETWQRADAADVSSTKDYPIGDNVELMSVRIRGLTCRCAESPAAAAGSEPTAAPAN